MTPDLKTLRQVAEKATPGPWSHSRIYHYDQTLQYIRRKSSKEIVIETASGISPENWRFLVRFNPKVCLELLDRLEELEGKLWEIEQDSIEKSECE